MPLGKEVCLDAGDVLDWNPAPLPPKEHSFLQFWVHVCCDQTAGWIKMPLGIEVGLGPGNIVLDWDPALPPQRGTAPPVFGQSLLWPNGWWIKVTPGREVCLGLGHCVLDGVGDPGYLPQRGTASTQFSVYEGRGFVERVINSPQTRLCLLCPKQSPISATAEHLLWPPYGIGQAIIFSCCGFCLSSIFFFWFTAK